MPVSSSQHSCRVVLLLDLDCFYAQCERVRLGLDAANAEVALLQWNSVLAVTYPARRYGIARGDSWEAVQTKSQGKCLALHLPILQVDSTVNARSNVEQAYQQEYMLTEEQRKQIMTDEVGVQRHAHEGKACLERYRLASTRIFSIVLETLNETLGKSKFVLERASIDEMFVDVTSYCWETIDTDTEQQKHAMEETVIVGESVQQQDDENVRIALERGCVVAKQIRNAVLQKLGFTLSAGISINKTVAKLGASYGKPNGQAVIFPQAITKVMEETKIRKVRNFGGKIGKKVQALLPNDEETMGSIARLLSLPVLSRELGSETGRMVFDASRGIDNEPVKETAGALVKSITAFKSFSRTLVTSDEIIKWLTLLSTDVVSRVEQDCARNERYPQSLSIHYTCSKADTNERISRSVRIPFPRAGEEQKKSKLVQRAREAILAKEGSVFLYRIGLCATDFDIRLRNGISTYFTKAESKLKKEKVGSDETEDHNAVMVSTDEMLARKLQQEYDGRQRKREGNEIVTLCSIPREHNGSPAVATRVEKCVDKDFEYAQKLQASYDRENMVLNRLESRSNRKSKASDAKKGTPSKKMRLENFFGKPK